jgi:hypothetical protein
MTMNALAAVTRFERDLLIERTQSGLQRAWAADSDDVVQAYRYDVARGNELMSPTIRI